MISIRDLHRAMQFAAAAYGWSILNHMASIFNLNFMPTAQPKWKNIATPRSAKSDSNFSRSLEEPDSEPPASASSYPYISSTRDHNHRSDDMEERMQANLSGETTIMSVLDGINPEDIIYSNFTVSQSTTHPEPFFFSFVVSLLYSAANDFMKALND